MAPVIAYLPGDQAHDQACGKWQGGRSGQETARNGLMHRPGHYADRHAQQQCREQAAQEIVREIDDNPLAQNSVRGDHKNALQWHKDHREDHQPYKQPDDIGQERRSCEPMI